MEQEPARSRDRTRAASSNAGADVDKRTKRFLVLVPHGNIRALMTSPRAELLRRGWLGALSPVLCLAAFSSEAGLPAEPVVPVPCAGCQAVSYSHR